MTQCCKSRAARRMGSAALTAAAEEEDEAGAAGAGAGAGAAGASPGEGACGGERGVEERATAAHARREEQHAPCARAWRPAQRRWRRRRRRRRQRRRARRRRCSQRRRRPRGQAHPQRQASRWKVRRAHGGTCSRSTRGQRAAMRKERGARLYTCLLCVRAEKSCHVLKKSSNRSQRSSDSIDVPPFAPSMFLHLHLQSALTKVINNARVKGLVFYITFTGCVRK